MTNSYFRNIPDFEYVNRIDDGKSDGESDGEIMVLVGVFEWVVYYVIGIREGKSIEETNTK